jgi:hypothetical protein
MFMCVVHHKLVNKLDLTWKQSFLILACLIVTDLQVHELMFHIDF